MEEVRVHLQLLEHLDGGGVGHADLVLEVVVLQDQVGLVDAVNCVPTAEGDNNAVSDATIRGSRSRLTTARCARRQYHRLRSPSQL